MATAHCQVKTTLKTSTRTITRIHGFIMPREEDIYSQIIIKTSGYFALILSLTTSTLKQLQMQTDDVTR